MTKAEPLGPSAARRRVVVLLEDSRHGRRTLEAAAGLAAWHRAPLVAVFVREESLLRRTACGFTMEYGALTGRARRVDAIQLETRLRGQESRFREALDGLALSLGLSCSLSVCTGNVVRETLAVLQPQDLLVMGKCTAPDLLGSRIGGSCQALIGACAVPLMLWDQPARASGPVLLSLSASRLVASEVGWRMQAVLDWFQSSGDHDVVHRLNAGTPEQQLLRASQYAGGLLVLSRSLAGNPRRLAAIGLPIVIWPD